MAKSSRPTWFHPGLRPATSMWSWRPVLMGAVLLPPTACPLQLLGGQPLSQAQGTCRLPGRPAPLSAALRSLRLQLLAAEGTRYRDGGATSGSDMAAAVTTREARWGQETFSYGTGPRAQAKLTPCGW